MILVKMFIIDVYVGTRWSAPFFSLYTNIKIILQKTCFSERFRFLKFI